MLLPIHRSHSHQDELLMEADEEILEFEKAEKILSDFFPAGLIEKYFKSNRTLDKAEGIKQMTGTMFEKSPELEIQEAIILFIKSKFRNFTEAASA